MNSKVLTTLFFIALLSVQASFALTFTVTVPEGTKVCYIAGNFNGWSQQEMTSIDTNKYSIDIPGVQSSTAEYKYCSGPDWAYVEKGANSEELSNRRYNTNDVVVRWAAIYEPSVQTGNHTLERYTFTTFTPLQGSRRVVIYLPPDYQTNTEKRYPVLYMHDAQNVFESGPYGTWNMGNALQKLYDEGKHVGIVVTIDNSVGRLKEYAPFGNPKYEGGISEGNEYLQAIKDHIIPYVNANYRTLTDKENTGILGSSMGGLISYYAGLKESETFGRIGVMSPSFWFCKSDLVNYLNNWTGTTPEKTKMYFICGDNEADYVPGDTYEFYNLTKGKGFKAENLVYEVVKGGGHNEASWATQIGRVYEFLFNLNNQSSVNTPQEQLDVKLKTENNQLQVVNNIGDACAFKLYDVSGYMYAKTTIESNFQTGFLSSGIYIAQIKHKEQVQSRKVVVR